MSMQSSVELRVPFLDLEFLALVEQMPSRYKISMLGERKWLYRRAVRGLLPEGLRDSLTGWRARTGRKLGFTTPLQKWTANWVDRDAEAYLVGPKARLPAYVDGDRLRDLISLAKGGKAVRGRQLMSLYVLEAWMRGDQA
jgi:asparagine synthase (glutamine-hydrolysing)